jgi:hypothetical protein
MNTAEPSVTQELVSGEEPAAVVGGPSSPRGYWWRLAKAAGLVLVGITVHLWIDGPLPSITQDAISTQIPADTLIYRAEPPVPRPSPRLAPEEPEPLSAPPVESLRAVATSGNSVVAERDRRASTPELLDARTYHRIATVSPRGGGILRTGGLPDVPTAALPMLPSAPRFSGWTGEAVALSPVAIPGPAAAEARSPTGAAAPPAAAPSAARVARALPVTPRREEESILLVLHEYEAAVGRKDPAAAKAVWPALDDRALARAFNDLQSHSLALEDCGVTVANSHAAARARCQGVATYLPKVGRRKPISASHEWTFNLSKTGGDWQIESAAIR